MADLPGGDAVHEVVAAVLAVTPVDEDGQVFCGRVFDVGAQIWGDPAPIAARQAAAVLRWAAGHMRLGDDERHNLRALADEIDPKESRDDHR